jgi:hypothetical protein
LWRGFILRPRRFHRYIDTLIAIPTPGVSGVVKVVPVVGISYVDVIRVIPIGRPVARIRVNHAEPIASILEAGIPTDDQEREAADAESVSLSEAAAEAFIGNAISVVPATLLPGSMVRLPV